MPPAMSPSRERLLTWPFALAFAANLFQGLALHGYLHLPRFLSGLGADEAMVGTIFGTLSGAAIFIRPFAGRIMDGRGRRPVIIAGGVIHVVACALYLTVDDIGPWVFVVRALQGFASGALFSSLFTYAADIVPASRRTEGIGLFGVSGMLPMALGGLLGDVVLSLGSFSDLFLVSVAISAFALLLSLPLSEPNRQAVGGRGFFAAAGQRDLLPIWFVGSTFAMALSGIFSFLANFVSEEQVGTVGLFFSAYSGSAIVLRVFFGWVPDKVGRWRVLGPSFVAMGAAMGLLAMADDWVALVASGIVAGLGHGYAFPILSAVVVERANPADRGSAISLFTAVFDLGILLGSPALGALAEATDYRTMYAVAATLPVIGLLGFLVWDRRVAPSAA